MLQKNSFIILSTIALVFTSCNASETASQVKEALDAKKKSDSILEEFKKVDASLDSVGLQTRQNDSLSAIHTVKDIIR